MGEPTGGGGILIRRGSDGRVESQPVAAIAMLPRAGGAQTARRGRRARSGGSLAQVAGVREAARVLATCWRQLGPVMSMRMACIASRSRIAAVKVASPR
jgi:hypothetical protein